MEWGVCVVWGGLGGVGVVGGLCCGVDCGVR